jgi:hypothetical protein
LSGLLFAFSCSSFAEERTEQNPYGIFPQIARTRIVGMITFQNGIMTSSEEYEQMTKTIAEKVSLGTLLLGVYNPTYGCVEDCKRFSGEILSDDGINVAKSKQFYFAIGTSLANANPGLLWLHIAHGEAGIILQKALQEMPQEQKAIFKRQLYVLTYGTLHPISNDVTFRAKNAYSTKDYAIMGSPANFISCSDIQCVNCLSITPERKYWPDYAFLGKIYQIALKNDLDEAMK